MSSCNIIVLANQIILRSKLHEMGACSVQTTDLIGQDSYIQCLNSVQELVVSNATPQSADAPDPILDLGMELSA